MGIFWECQLPCPWRPCNPRAVQYPQTLGFWEAELWIQPFLLEEWCICLPDLIAGTSWLVEAHRVSFWDHCRQICSSKLSYVKNGNGNVSNVISSSSAAHVVPLLGVDMGRCEIIEPLMDSLKLEFLISWEPETFYLGGNVITPTIQEPDYRSPVVTVVGDNLKSWGIGVRKIHKWKGRVCVPSFWTECFWTPRPTSSYVEVLTGPKTLGSSYISMRSWEWSHRGGDLSRPEARVQFCVSSTRVVFPSSPPLHL